MRTMLHAQCTRRRCSPSIFKVYDSSQSIISWPKRRTGLDTRRLAHAKSIPSLKGSKTVSRLKQGASFAPTKAVPYESLDKRLANRDSPTLLYQASSYRPVHAPSKFPFNLAQRIGTSLSAMKHHIVARRSSVYSLPCCADAMWRDRR